MQAIIAPRRRVRGWPVVVIPAVIYLAFGAQFIALSFTAAFDSDTMTVPDTLHRELKHGHVYAFTLGYGAGDDPNVDVTVTDPDGDELELRDKTPWWSWAEKGNHQALDDDLGAVVPTTTGRHTIKVGGTTDAFTFVDVTRQPFAYGSPEGRRNLVGSVLALVAFLPLFLRWRRARARRTTSDTLPTT